MPNDSLQYHNESVALDTLINSEEFVRDHPSVIPFLEEYKDSLCLHEWAEQTHDNHDDDEYKLEQCKKCKAERESYS